MPVVTPILVLIILAAGTLAGGLGSTLGIGGGIFLVPFLTLGMGMPIGVAAAISLTTVIGTSSTVSAGRTGSRLINYRLGMVLEVATAAGSLLGGITAQHMNQHTLRADLRRRHGGRGHLHGDAIEQAQRRQGR